jgi:hypothetical protein
MGLRWDVFVAVHGHLLQGAAHGGQGAKNTKVCFSEPATPRKSTHPPPWAFFSFFFSAPCCCLLSMLLLLLLLLLLLVLVHADCCCMLTAAAAAPAAYRAHLCGIGSAC